MFVDSIRRFEVVLIIAGVALVAAFLAMEVDRRYTQAQLEEELDLTTKPATAPPTSNPGRKHGPLGKIEIPRVGISAVILDGVDDQTLGHAVGHIPGTAYPGDASGRIALAAHRDTFFRDLRHVKNGDLVRLAAPGGALAEYTIVDSQIVDPDEVDVIAKSKQPLLTLVTCYPFNYVGNAPQRYVVQARLVDKLSAISTPPKKKKRK
jgi:sortase A